MAKKSTKKLQDIGKLVEAVGESGKKRRGYKPYRRRNEGLKPYRPNNNTAHAETTPYIKSRPYGLHEYKGVGSKLRYGASHVAFVGDTVGSGENFADEYRDWKAGRYAKKRETKRIHKL